MTITIIITFTTVNFFGEDTIASTVNIKFCKFMSKRFATITITIWLYIQSVREIEEYIPALINNSKSV
uniref:Uncharacterized protein n=1 Tax=Rhizophagus irregularis (strain DAOM 181602 / DAOM 197198 / MUCL 43194) TaxID=747089 RepID=U9U4N6_RHIID